MRACVQGTQTDKGPPVAAPVILNGGTRTLLNPTANYTGISKLTLGAEGLYGWEHHEGFLRLIETRQDSDATWWGWAGYVAYDFTERLRGAVRLERFVDPQGARTQTGKKVSLYDVTATVQYRIWRGLVGRLEYRHDSANTKVFKVRAPGLVPTSTAQDTITVNLYYLFF